MKKNKDHVLLAAAMALFTIAQALCPAVQAEAGGGITATILIPTYGSYVSGKDVTFAGMAAHSDNSPCNGCTYEWVSSIDGTIGVGAGFTIDNLSVGRHVIEFRVLDEYGAKAVASKNIEITPAPLRLMINSPVPERIYSEGSILLDASVSGGVPPYSYAWKSGDTVLSISGQNDAEFAPGEYTLDLEVTDARGASAGGTAYLQVVEKINPLGSRLTVSIDSPKNYEYFKEGAVIRFNATVSGGRAPYAYAWTTDEGAVGSVKEFSLANYSEPASGIKTVKLSVVDAAGGKASSSVLIQFRKVCNVDGMCYTGENYINCPKDCPSGSSDGYCDRIQDGRCDPDCKAREDPDC